MFADHFLDRRVSFTHYYVVVQSTSLPSSLLVGELAPEVVVLAMRILQTVLHFLHMFASITSHTINNQGYDTSLTNPISTAFPPHGTS